MADDMEITRTASIPANDVPAQPAPPDYFGDLVKLVASRLGIAPLATSDPGTGIVLGAADGSRYSATAIVNEICDKLDDLENRVAYGATAD